MGKHPPLAVPLETHHSRGNRRGTVGDSPSLHRSLSIRVVRTAKRLSACSLNRMDASVDAIPRPIGQA